MVNAARKDHAAPANAASETGFAAKRPAKVAVYLVTQDEALWPTIGAGLEPSLVLQQVDSIDELQRVMQSGQPGIVIWDTRDEQDRLGGLSRLQLHSPGSACIAIDSAEHADDWKSALKQRRVAALLQTPIQHAPLAAAVVAARDEFLARAVLLGDGSTDAGAGAGAASTAHGSAPRAPWVWPAAGAALLCLAAAAYFWNRTRPANEAPAAPPAPAAPAASAPAAAPGVPAAVNAATSSNDEKVEVLLDKARQAMLERRFIEPADANALSFYRDALIFDPPNGEARQGLQRLAQILLARAQSSLDERKFDLALQSLETARSISPGDARLAALDAKFASLRAELRTAQIQAAVNAKNFDRAAQLIDEAARAKSLSAAKLAQLREDLHRRRQESDVEHFAKLIDARLQQNRLLEPRKDSASFYLEQAREAGASPADLDAQTQEYANRLLLAARASIDQHRLGDVDRMLSEARNYGAAAPALAVLQQDLAAARALQARQKADMQQLLSLAQARFDQGALTEPANDSALSYAAQLRAAEPTNAQVTALAARVQAKILERASAALEAGDGPKTEALLNAAGTLGAAPPLTALSDALAQWQQSQSAAAHSATARLVMTKPLAPDYPPDAQRHGTEGWVDLAFTVTGNGKVRDVTVLGASPPKVFEAAARSAMKRVRYQPVLKDGKPIEVTSKVRVVFRLGQH